MKSVTILDLVDIIHFAIIAKLGKDEILLPEIQAIESKIKLGQVENYDVTDTSMWKYIVRDL